MVTPGQSEKMTVETGWLIEKGRLCLGLCENTPAWVTFCDPTAIRFARKSDAENMLRGLKSFTADPNEGFHACTVKDHSWG